MADTTTTPDATVQNSAPGAAPTTPGGPAEVFGPSCWALPTSGTATPLVDADIQAAATRLNVEAAAVYAVSDVESGGLGGFDSQKRPRILFEVSRFQDYTNGPFGQDPPRSLSGLFEPDAAGELREGPVGGSPIGLLARPRLGGAGDVVGDVPGARREHGGRRL